MLSFNLSRSGQQVVSPMSRATEPPCSFCGAGSDQDEVTAKWQDCGRSKALFLGRKSKAGSEDRCVVQCVQQCLTLGFGVITEASRCVN